MGLADIVLWKYKTNKKGKSQILIRVIEERKPRYLRTGLYSTKEDWDQKENRFRTKYRKSEDYQKAIQHKKNNEILEKKLRDANDLIRELTFNENIISSEQVKEEIIKSKSIGKHSILRFIDTIVEEKKTQNKYGTAKCYHDLKNSLLTFLEKENKKDLVFKEVTHSFLKKYESYFRERGATGNGISFYMRSLRAVFNRAITDGCCKKEMYPFDAYKISSLSTQTVKRAITKEEIDLIKQFQTQEDSRMFQSKVIFLFSYYTRGLNFADLATLKWKNIEKNRLIYLRKKTNKQYNIQLLGPVVEMLNHFKQNYYKGENSYIFPILDEEKHKTATSISNRLHKVLGQTNKDLKELGEKIGLKTALTTYVARHTFATVMKRSGISTSIISEALGHDSERTTQIYLDSFANDVLDEASNSLL